MIGYATVQELIDYADARGVDIELSQESILLTKAFDWLSIQPLTIPDPAPDKIKTAQLVCALIYNAGGDPLEAIRPRVTQESVAGAVSVSYSDSGPATPLYPQLQALMRPYLSAGVMGGNNFAVVRG